MRRMDGPDVEASGLRDAIAWEGAAM